MVQAGQPRFIMITVPQGTGIKISIFTLHWNQSINTSYNRAQRARHRKQTQQLTRLSWCTSISLCMFIQDTPITC